MQLLVYRDTNAYEKCQLTDKLQFSLVPIHFRMILRNFMFSYSPSNFHDIRSP